MKGIDLDNYIGIDLDRYKGIDLDRYRGIEVKDMEHVIHTEYSIYNNILTYDVVIEMQGVHKVTGNSYKTCNMMKAFEIIDSNCSQDDLIMKHVNALADKLDKDRLLELLPDIMQGDIYEHNYRVEEFNDYHVIIIDNNEDKVVSVDLNNELLTEVKSGGWLNKLRMLGVR